MPFAAPPSPQEIHRKLSVHSVARSKSTDAKSTLGPTDPPVSSTESDSDSIQSPSLMTSSGQVLSSTLHTTSSVPPLSSIAERRSGSGEDSEEEEEEEGGWKAAASRRPTQDSLDEGVIKSGYLWKKGERRKTWKKRWFVLRPAHLAYYKSSAEYQLLRLLELSDVHSCTAVTLKRHENTFGLVSPARTFYLQAKTSGEVQEWIQAIEDARLALLATTTQNSVSTPIAIPTPTRRSTSNLVPAITPSPPSFDPRAYTVTSSDSEDASPSGHHPLAVSFQQPPPSPSRPLGFAPKDPSSKTVLSGYLMKCGSKRRNWRKRWFVLSEDKLIYSGSHMDTKPHRQFALAQIIDALEFEIPPNRNGTSLTSGSLPTSVSPLSEGGDTPQCAHTFKIVTTKRTLLLCAPSEADEIKWLGSIRALIARRSGVPGEQAVHGNSSSRNSESHPTGVHNVGNAIKGKGRRPSTSTSGTEIKWKPEQSYLQTEAIYAEVYGHNDLVGRMRENWLDCVWQMIASLTPHHLLLQDEVQLNKRVQLAPNQAAILAEFAERSATNNQTNMVAARPVSVLDSSVLVLVPNVLNGSGCAPHKESRNVTDLREKIKVFLASQGMIKGHSNGSPRGVEVESPTLHLREDYSTSSESPSTPTLSLTETPRALHMISSMRDDPYTHEYAPSSSTLVSPAIQSSFGQSYSYFNTDDLIPLEYEPFHPQNPDQSYYLVDMVLNHYRERVVKAQYIFANNSIRNLVCDVVMSHRRSRDAASLLSSVHWQRFCNPHALAFESDETRQRLRDIQNLLNRQSYSSEDAMAALHVVSSYLFDGGSGDWERWLQVSNNYVDSLFRRYSPSEALLTGDDQNVFIIKTSIWFDVLASVTTQRRPHFYDAIKTMFDPTLSRIQELGSEDPSSMMSAMGCHNVVVWALSETSALFCWKQEQLANDCLSVPTLVEKAAAIEEHLQQSYPPTFINTDVEGCRLLAAEIFRAAARLYLRAVVSGDHPNVPDISSSVEETIACIDRLNHPHCAELVNGQTMSGSVMRNTVFGFFICGAFAQKQEHRNVIRNLLDREGDGAGNCGSIRKLLHQMWEQRDKARPHPASRIVNWRLALAQEKILLV
ncbi:hypothetical protein H0H93_001022 [Arthromyces matolae]|nr:hypothetical protein H0H93_001022 [Arthromyces matolae]